MIVVDSNIIAARSLTSSLTSQTREIEERDPVWIVPVLWRYEFQNILATAIRTKQIRPEQAMDIWEEVSKILIENEFEPSASKVIDLVARYGISAYDGQFIALALEMGIPCVTEDRELRKKFPGTAISMDEFIKPDPTSVVREARARYRLSHRRREGRKEVILGHRRGRTK
jgi:predicted nucleic acid-binding protein